MARLAPNVIRVAGIALICVLTVPALAQSFPKVGAECKNLHVLSNQAKRLKTRFDNLRIGDKPARCKVETQILANNEALLHIFYSDPEHCGLRDDFLNALSSSTDRLRQSLPAVCNASALSERIESFSR